MNFILSKPLHQPTPLALTLAVAATATTTFGAVQAWRLCAKYQAVMSKIGYNWKALLLAALRQPWLSCQHLYLETTTDDTTSSSCLLIIYSEPGIPSTDYLPLARLVQAKAARQGLNMHVGIAQWSKLWPRNGDALANLLALQKKAGSSVPLFVLGHGKGIENVLLTNPMYHGLIRIGSLAMESALSSFPKPCLTILGDQDEHIGYWSLAPLLEDLEQNYNYDDLDKNHVPIPKPILLLTKANHSGFLLDNYEGKIMLDQMACVVANFVRVLVSGQVHEYQQLDKMTHNTVQSRLQPYRKLCHKDTMREVGTRIQQAIYEHEQTGHNRAQLPLPVSVHVTQTLPEFVYSKPILGKDFVQVIVYCNNQGPRQTTTTDDGRVVLHSGTWAIKCKSQKALHLALTSGQDADDDEPKILTTLPNVFENINRQTFQYVLDHIVSPLEKEQYLNDPNVTKLDFGPDIFPCKSTLSPIPWIISDLHFTTTSNNDNDKKKVLVVSSSVAVFSMSSQSPLKFRGMHYAKVLSPAQCYEWIVSAAWRQNQANK